MVDDDIRKLALKHQDGLVLSEASVKELAEEWNRRQREDDYQRCLWLYKKLRELKKASA